MQELIINLHMHTTYSDGSGTHAELVKAALSAGLDAIISTDHNILVNGPQGYYRDGDQRVLLMIGEEVHDTTAAPQKNHLLVIGTNRELADQADNTQRLIHKVREYGGLAFIAHPVDPAAPVFGEPDISWENWAVDGYSGIELWNAMSEFKSLLKDRISGVFYAFNPRLIAHGPFPGTLQKWDELLSEGKKVVAIGGSDAHAFRVSAGVLRRTLFPYEFHFRAINTHVFVPRALSGDEIEDRDMILDSLAKGHAFVGYDLPAPTRDFRFTAQGTDNNVLMGDELPVGQGVTLQIHLPQRAECHLLKDGKVIKTWNKREVCTHITTEPGVYRVEVYVRYMGRRRGWIFSNPIYVRE